MVTGFLLLPKKKSTGCQWLQLGLPPFHQPLLLPVGAESYLGHALHTPLAHSLVLQLLQPPGHLCAPVVGWVAVDAQMVEEDQGGYGVCWSSLNLKTDKKQMGNMFKKHTYVFIFFLLQRQNQVKHINHLIQTNFNTCKQLCQIFLYEQSTNYI